MPDPTDLIIQATFMSEDDKRFAKERGRKSTPKPTVPVLPDGPCCARCEHWKAPGSHDEFGTCLMLATVGERTTFGPERGTIVAVELALQQVDWAWDYLATKPYLAGCSRFSAAQKDEAA